MRLAGQEDERKHDRTETDLLDRADFRALSEAAAARGRWEFMLTIAPLPIPNGTGSPVNPIAMF